MCFLSITRHIHPRCQHRLLTRSSCTAKNFYICDNKETRELARCSISYNVCKHCKLGMERRQEEIRERQAEAIAKAEPNQTVLAPNEDGGGTDRETAEIQITPQYTPPARERPYTLPGDMALIEHEIIACHAEAEKRRDEYEDLQTELRQETRYVNAALDRLREEAETNLSPDTIKTPLQHGHKRSSDEAGLSVEQEDNRHCNKWRAI